MAASQPQQPGTTTPVLAARGLKVTFSTQDGLVEAVRGIDFHVNAREVLGIVGESGSGKSQTVLAAMGLLASNGRVEGSVKFHGTELIGMPLRELNRLRGAKMSMIFQDPLTSLTPHMRVGQQIAEVLTEHAGVSAHDAERRALEMLEMVRITDAKRRLTQYPHELSGGMRQRIMIAMALVNRPEILIADEPTTALDVTIQAQILDLMRDLQRDFGTAVILITHDMGVVAGMCDRVEVMRQGIFVEEGDVNGIFYRPQHAYTKMLIDAMPSIDNPEKHGTRLPPVKANGGAPLLDVENVKVLFPVRVGTTPLLLPKVKPLRAVDGVSFKLDAGETIGIVGESGCGKSTLARAILQLVHTTSGDVVWLGKSLASASKSAIRNLRGEFQIVFQDPLASLDPR
ncbi:MAG TPA: ATP-binding cassette domain-containing protein, partial [Alphaproteobacteria bacterium]|nr:ATP-binding cassette domain-containing protein [Alphaproteobacteria bacterium]